MHQEYISSPHLPYSHWFWSLIFNRLRFSRKLFENIDPFLKGSMFENAQIWYKEYQENLYYLFFIVGPTSWITVHPGICYQGSPKEGNFAIPQNEIYENKNLFAIRLVHVSGSVECKGSTLASENRWGCDNKHNMQMRIWHDNGTEGKFRRKGDNSYPGFSVSDDVLIIKKRNWYQNWPDRIRDGQKFEIFSMGTESKTDGHCVRLDVSFAWVRAVTKKFLFCFKTVIRLYSLLAILWFLAGTVTDRRARPSLEVF